jgi:hypothetical protein
LFVRYLTVMWTSVLSSSLDGDSNQAVFDSRSNRRSQMAESRSFGFGALAFRFHNCDLKLGTVRIETFLLSAEFSLLRQSKFPVRYIPVIRVNIGQDFLNISHILLILVLPLSQFLFLTNSSLPAIIICLKLTLLILKSGISALAGFLRSGFLSDSFATYLVFVIYEFYMRGPSLYLGIFHVLVHISATACMPGYSPTLYEYLASYYLFVSDVNVWFGLFFATRMLDLAAWDFVHIIRCNSSTLVVIS